MMEKGVRGWWGREGGGPSRPWCGGPLEEATTPVLGRPRGGGGGERDVVDHHSGGVVRGPSGRPAHAGWGGWESRGNERRRRRRRRRRDRGPFSCGGRRPCH